MIRRRQAAIAAPLLVWLASCAAAQNGGDQATAASEEQAACVPSGAGVPAGANISDPAKPFFVATNGLDLSTSPPTRDPLNPAYPRATALADAALPAPGADGNFIIGPTHAPAHEAQAHDGIATGSVQTLSISSADSLIYKPGVVREDRPGCMNGALNASLTAPGDPSDVRVTASHTGNWTRDVDVYIPHGLRRDRPAPFIVFGDGGKASFFNERMLFTVLDNMITEHRLPPMVAIGVGAGGQDAQGSERGREYDAVNGLYAEWVEHEVLPHVEHATGLRLTRDPDQRITMGFSSSGVAAFTMAWFHPELYHRVLAYSPTFTNQQWPHDPVLPGGAWQYHSPWPGPQKPALTARSPWPGPGLTTHEPTTTPAMQLVGVPLVPDTVRKPIRFWFETGDRDLFYNAPNMPDGMHDWTLSDERMAAALATKDYHYQFLFAHNAGHVDEAVEAQTLPEALVWVWNGGAVVHGSAE